MERASQAGGFGAGAAAPGARTRGAPGTRVYVGNLSWEAQWQEVKDHMRGLNQDLVVTHADIMHDASGRSKGCAIVEYASSEDAQRAIAQLNDTELMGRLIFVREDREVATAFRGGFRGGGGMRGGMRGRGGFNPNFQPGFQQFPQAGGRGGFRGGRGGFAPRTFQQPVQGGVPGASPAPGTAGRRVYVGNLSWETQWQELKDHMRSAGQVEFADVLTGPDGRSKGCAVVEFAQPEEAQRAIAELNDTQLMGRMIFVREDREAR